MAGADETFDFVIVGSGGGSMCAALVVRSMGKSVLILEKTDLVGGTTSRSGGIMWIPNNPFMKPGEDSREKSLQYLSNFIDEDDFVPGATPERREAYVDQGPRMVEFLLEKGVKLKRYPHWPDYYNSLPGGIADGRAVIAELFDSSELGEAQTKLRPNYVPLPAHFEEVMAVQLAKSSWKSIWAMLKIGLRMKSQQRTGKNHVTAGAALQGRMFQQALKHDVDIRTNAGVSKLVTDDSGRVTGVVVTIDGKESTIEAREGVLVNAGGFARNQEMRDKYQPGTRAEWSNTISGDTGEMIQEMMRIGAAIGHMEEMVGNQMALTPEKYEVHAMVMAEQAKPHTIVVDQTGERYMREAQSYMAACKAMFERNKIAPSVPSWCIMDTQYIDKYMLAGSLPVKNQMMNAGTLFEMIVGTPAEKSQLWYDSGFLVKADTLEELAQKCGMDPAKFVPAVKRFNEFARKGVDEDFHRGDRAYDQFLGDYTHKPNASLGTIEKGPFYAYKSYPGDVGTYGGVVTDANARVLREDGSVIQGLYATGVSTAGVFGRYYPGPGASVGPSFVWGYVAAKHAMGINTGPGDEQGAAGGMTKASTKATAAA